MKFGMMICPAEEDTYYECEADSLEEAISQGQDYANRNFCYVVDEETVDEVKE